MTTADRRRAVFLDRDGTIIQDVGYPRDPAAVTPVPGALESLLGLSRLGYALAVVSNQSGVARGLVTRAEAAAVHDRFVAVCEDAGVRFAAVAYCFHGPSAGCACRKPAPGMLLDIARRLDIDREHSVMVGDKPTDIEAGRRAGCRTILIGSSTGRSDEEPGERAPVAAQGTPSVASNWADVFALICDVTHA